MTEHSPTPWEAKRKAVLTTDGAAGPYLVAEASVWWTDPATAEANAAHIVQCVNEHEDVQALVKSAQKLSRITEQYDEDDSLYVDSTGVFVELGTLRAVRAALAPFEKE